VIPPEIQLINASIFSTTLVILKFTISSAMVSFLSYVLPSTNYYSLTQNNLPPGTDYAIFVDALISDIFW
jgi:hypothetical protein